MNDAFNPKEVVALFSGRNQEFLFARWGRPLAPMVIGVDDQTLRVVKGAFEAVATLIGRPVLADTDPELGANCIVFFFREWRELRDVPELDRLIGGLSPLVDQLEAAHANQYRTFRFDQSGAIKAAFVFLRMDDQLAAIPAQDLALSQVAQVFLVWSESAFAKRSPLAKAGDVTVLRPDISNIIRVAYDPVLPDSSRDPTFALRLSARLGAQT